MRKSLLLLLCCILTVGSAFADEFTGAAYEGYGFWRLNFTYETTDLDGETPITLSGAIFMDKDVWKGKIASPGYALCSHYTVTSNAQCASNCQTVKDIEAFVAYESDFVVIASDGRGFGETRSLQQSYLLGRTTARNNIDAFLAGKKLLEEYYPEIKVGNIMTSIGYSQGGHSTMWVNRLVAEGYRGDELPKIDYTLSGGGPYDIYGMYLDMLQTGKSTYPVAVMLIFDGLIAEGKCGITEEDVYLPEVQEHIPEWISSKEYTTDQVNAQVYSYFGGNKSDGIELSKILKPECLDTASSVMQRVIPRLKANSLVYDDWAPTNTGEIYFAHSTKDEIVPYLNWESLDRHLTEMGYRNYSIGDYSTFGHEWTGTTFAIWASAYLASYAKNHPDNSAKANSDATGIETATYDAGNAGNHKVYRIDGTEVTNTENLAPGIYIRNHKKFVVK